MVYFPGMMSGNGNGGTSQSWAALRGNNGIGNSMGFAGLQSAYARDAGDAGGIYKLVDGEFVEASYNNGKATWDSASSSTTGSSSSTGAGGSGGGGSSGFVYNGVWAAAKGGKSMASNPMNKMKAIDWFSKETRQHLDNIADDPARAKAHRYDKYNLNRVASQYDRVRRFNALKNDPNIDRKKLSEFRERMNGQHDGDIARAVGKGSAKALFDHIGTRIDKLKSVDYDTMKKRRQQVLSDLAAGVERGKDGKIIKEGKGVITREGLARTQGQIRDERSKMGQRPEGAFSEERWAKVKAAGATSMGYAQWKDWAQRRAKEEDSKRLSDKIWRAELDKRKLDRAEEKLAAVDDMKFKNFKEIKRLEGLQTEVGNLLKTNDAAAVNEVAEKLAGGVVKMQGPDIQRRMQDDIAEQDTQGASVQEVADFLARQTAAKGGHARRKFKVLSRRNRGVR